MSIVAQILPTKSMEDAIADAKRLIEEERSGRVAGLYTRWEGINRAKMRYCRFRSVTAIAGMSGSGKSAILNMIEDDFTNPAINPTFLAKENPNPIDKGGRTLVSGWEVDNKWIHNGKMILEPKIVLVCFKYEMDAADEILRNLSGRVGKSYSYLLSSELGPPVDGGLGKPKKRLYNRITDEEYNKYSILLDEIKNKPIKYIEQAGNLDQMWNTCAKIQEENPGKRLVITLDHTLLSQKLSEKDDLELMSRTAKLAIRLRKSMNAMVIFLCQMNGQIEDVRRRDNPDLHFPVKTDIHGANQIYWACDDVLIFHRPELIGITKYGKIPFPMQGIGLIHCNWVKSRKNRSGSIWFLNRFEEGKILQISEEQARWTGDLILL